MTRIVRIIDLFAGIGGMTCGFVQASTPALQFEPVFAVEIDAALAGVYHRNFGDHIHAGDIASVKDFPSAEVIIGGPPCQGFSRLGRDRDSQSRRQLNRLWRHFFRAVEEVRPSVFVMENVPELLRAREFATFKRLTGERGLGYQIAEGVLLAADFGVPQLRRRAIVIGSLLGDPPWPQPTHTAQRHMTVYQALKDLPLEPDGRFWHRRRPNVSAMSIERYRAIPEGGNRFDLAVNRPDLLIPCWRDKPTGTTDGFGRLWWNRPAVTIRTEFFKPEKGRYLHPQEDRPITVREAACLQSFPRRQARPPHGFILPEDISMTAIARGIGNAVPPKLARAIAGSVAQHLLADAAARSGEERTAA